MPKKYLSRVVLLIYILSSAHFLYAAHRASGAQASADFPPVHWRPKQPVSDADFVGDETCAKCHAAIATRQRTTGMAQALETAAASHVLRTHPTLEAKFGPYSYRIERRGEQSVYTVTDGANQISAPVLYAFGRGEAGQTYVLRYGEEFYESRVSFYNRTGGLDLTIGAQAATPRSLVEAMGRPMTKQSAVDCFSCHATATNHELQLDEMMPGVGCEACHGPGEKHVAAMTKGDGKEAHIFNPAKLSGDEITNEFCGACHRSVDTVMALPDKGSVSSRTESF